MSIKETGYVFAKKKVLVLGAGGVVSSIIFALYKMGVSKVFLCNRTKTKAENLKNLFQNLEVVDWGEVPNVDIVINASSVGLNREDRIDYDFSKFKSAKFFYDIIYNPKETNFLKDGKRLGKKVENGKKMFIYQAAQSFKIWHQIEPEINYEINGLLDK